MATWSDQPLCTSVSARPSERCYLHCCARGVRWLIVAVLAVVRLGSAEAAAQKATLDHVLAIVDGQIIMHSDVRAFIDLRLVNIPTGPNQEVEVLSLLIERRVVLDQVDRFVVAEPAPEVVDRRLDLVQSRLPGGAGLDRILERVGLTADDLRQLVADDIRRDAYLADRFGVVAEGLREAATANWVTDLVRRARVRRVAGTQSPPGNRE